MHEIPRHQCLIYEGSPAPHLRALASAIEMKLKEKYRCMFLNSRPMVTGLRSYLFAVGVDVPNQIMNGSLVLSSDNEHLLDGRFDIDRMLGMLSDAVDRALYDGYQGLWATGDLGWEFGPENDYSKLMEYERRLEQLFLKHPALSGICQYHRDILPHETVLQGLQTHKALFVNETLSKLNPQYATI